MLLVRLLKEGILDWLEEFWGEVEEVEVLDFCELGFWLEMGVGGRSEEGGGFSFCVVFVVNIWEVYDCFWEIFFFGR